jgi:hypothetical protein
LVVGRWDGGALWGGGASTDAWLDLQQPGSGNGMLYGKKKEVRNKKPGLPAGGWAQSTPLIRRMWRPTLQRRQLVDRRHLTRLQSPLGAGYWEASGWAAYAAASL